MLTRAGLVVLLVAWIGGSSGLSASAKPGSKTVQGIGVVTAIDAKARRLTINHEDIKGFMGAMEMAYPVAGPASLNGLNTGDKIRFVINRSNGLIVGLKVTGRSP